MSKILLGLLAGLIATPAEATDPFGLIFVYATDCRASQRFSLSVKTVADHYAISVLPVSVNNARFGEWPDTVPDTGQIQALDISRVPYLALYDNRSGALIPITSRYLPAAQLEQLIAETLEAIQ